MMNREELLAILESNTQQPLEEKSYNETAPPYLRKLCFNLASYYRKDNRLVKFPHLKYIIVTDIQEYVGYYQVLLEYLKLIQKKDEITEVWNDIETFKRIHNEDYTCLHANWKDDFKALLKAITEYRLALNDQHSSESLAHLNLQEYIRLAVSFANTTPEQITATNPKIQALTVAVQRARDFIVYPNAVAEQNLFKATEQLLATGIDSRKLRRPQDSLFAYSSYLMLMLIGALKFTMLLALATYAVGLKVIAVGMATAVFGGILNIAAMNVEAMALASCLGTVGLAALTYASRRMISDLSTPWALNSEEKQIKQITEGHFKLCGAQISFFGKRFLPHKTDQQPPLTDVSAMQIHPSPL